MTGPRRSERGTTRNTEEGNQPAAQGGSHDHGDPNRPAAAAQAMSHDAAGSSSVGQQLSFIINKLEGLDTLKARLGDLTCQVSNNQSPVGTGPGPQDVCK